MTFTRKLVVLAVLAFAAQLDAQPAAYFRASGPAGYVITGASTTTPLVVQTFQPHNLQPGDVVANWGVGAMVSGQCVSSAANGIRTVKDVVDATHFSVTDGGAADVAANGAWCDGSRPGVPAGAAAGGKLTSFRLTAQPRVWLDGPSGDLTRKLALGTQNGLVSLSVTSKVATVTTSYPHGLTTGDKIGIWGSGVAALNNAGNGYTVTVTDATTFTFPTNASNKTYTNANNNCGPSGDQDCLRISQVAYAGSSWWDGLKGQTDTWSGNTNYMHKFDGGTSGVGGQPYNNLAQLANAAVRSVIDPSDSGMRAAAKYCVNNAEKFAGVNWTVYEPSGNAGNLDLNDFASYYAYPLSVCYVAARDYLSAAERQTFADKMYNDIDWLNTTPADTRKNFPRRKTLATGAAQAGTSTSITLAADDAAADGYYVNNVVAAIIGGNTSYGLVTGYNGATKVATVASWSAGAPAAGTSYCVYATITVSATASGAATVTGYNTAFTTDLAAGDAVIGSNAWTTLVEESQSYVSAVQSDTSLSVVNSQAVGASPSTPRILWILPRWTTGAPGLRFAQQHWEGAFGAMPSLYPSNAADQTAEPTQGSPQYPALAGNNLYTRTAAWLALDLALADDDPRALQDLAVFSTQWWDWQMRIYWWYSAGPGRNGSYYSTARDDSDAPKSMFVVRNSLQGFPDMDTSGAWTIAPATFNMYNTLPDRRYAIGSAQSVPWQHNYGAETGDTEWAPQSLLLNSALKSSALIFQPNALATQYYVGFLKSFCCAWGKGGATDAWYGVMMVDPRIKAADYTAQPTQKVFRSTSAGRACAATGWSCPPTWAGNAAVSLSSWTDRSATHLYFGVRGYYNGHDIPEAGTLRVYKVGHLLGTDQPYPGSGTPPQPGVAASGYHNAETNDSMPLFGGTGHLHGGYSGDGIRGEATITRWAAANRGAWDSSYGDAASRYMYVVADLSGMYNSGANITRAQRHVAHLKKPGTEEIIVQYDDIAVSTPESIEWHQHYPQTGEATSDSAASSSWREGSTTCPGGGGCADLNTTRTVLSQEDGSTDAHNPPRTNGVITQVFSPGTIAVRWDGTSYSGGWGHAARISVCAGGACGAAASGLESLMVHKIASRLDDTTLTAKTLSPDPRWAGVQTADKVVVVARNGETPISVNIQTDHQGTAQYLIAGLQGGVVYRVFRNDDETTVAEAAVSDGDNTLYFEAPAGSYAIFPTGLTNLFLHRKLPLASVGTPFQYEFGTGGGSEFRWSVAGGTVPPGLSLSAAGVLSGTPVNAADTVFVVKGESAGMPGVSATASFTLSVTQQQMRLNLTGTSSRQAILDYGRWGLDAAARCTITISATADFAETIESFTDGGGAARRLYVAGAATPLSAATTYYARAGCGASDGDNVTATFDTAPAEPVEAAVIPLTVRPPQLLGATAVEIQYGASPQLGSSVTAPCAEECSVSIPATAGAIVYIKRVYRGADSRIVATGSSRPVITRSRGVPQ